MGLRERIFKNMDLRERIYENTKALAKLRGIKISDVEKQIGVSTGYLSKTSKCLTVEKIYRIATVFGVTIDSLIKEDYAEICKERFAEYDLQEAVKAAKEVITEPHLLAIVKDELKNK